MALCNTDAISALTIVHTGTDRFKPRQWDSKDLRISAGYIVSGCRTVDPATQLFLCGEASFAVMFTIIESILPKIPGRLKPDRQLTL